MQIRASINAASCAADTSRRCRARCTLPRERLVAAKYRFGEYQENPPAELDEQMQTRRSNVSTGIVFSPSAEVGQTLQPIEAIPLGPSQVAKHSLGRLDYAQMAEVAINEQITTELTLSHFYLSASAYFARDNVGLPGFAAHFKDESDDERKHALRLIEFQVRRGGKVVLGSLLPPQTEFDHESKGDALHAMEIALGLEKVNFAKLRELHTLADEADDSATTHFIEDYLLDEQTVDVRDAAVLVSRLQRVGKGLGVVFIDQQLQQKYGVSLNSVPEALNTPIPSLGNGGAGGEGALAALG